MGLNEKFFKTSAVDDTPNFAPILYTGNGGTNVITGVGFAPDFVWIKGRTINVDHAAFDTVRGATKYISPSTFGAEGTYSTVLNAFGSDGFTVGSNSGVNSSSSTYVAWCWKAGGAAVSNTDGTTTSQVSANTNAGFSIVSYYGNSASGPTVGHGLSSKPELILFKNISVGNDWAVYSSPVTANYYMMLNKTNAKIDYQHMFNDTEPDSSVFTLGYQGKVNQSGNQYIAYAFHSVDGYQKIGSYTGAASSGLTVTTGFRPKWVMIKRTDSANDWVIIDSIRDTSDPYSKILWADLPDAEADGGSTTALSFSDTGFSMSTSAVGGSINASGGTYIYLAIA